jgi:Txe/YoeB family toxin of Txe-Axe toxin-antitoxin module
MVMTTTNLLKKQAITKDESERAIYLDFESRGNSWGERLPSRHEPVLAGILCEHEYNWFVLNEKMRLSIHAAQEPFAGKGSKSTLKEFVQNLYNRAVRENRRIVYWSSAEREIFRQFGIDISLIGYDVRFPAKKKFKNRFKEFKKDEKAYKSAKKKYLQDKLRSRAHGLLALIAADNGLEKVSQYEAGKVGTKIAYIDRTKTFTSACKRKWTKLLKHNRHDCVATQYVLFNLLKPWSDDVS